MKKSLFLVFSIFCVSGVLTLFAGNPITVKSGDVTVLSKNSTASYEFDYSATKVGKQTLNEYLKSKGDDYVRDWPDARDNAEKHFAHLFNHKNKKKMQFKLDGSEGDYKMKIHIKSIDMGNDGGVFVSSYAPKTIGGAVLTGTIDVIDMKTKGVVLSLDMGEIKGEHALTVRLRMLIVYDEIAKNLVKLK